MRHEVESSYTLIDIQQSIILVFMMLLALIFTLVKLEQQTESDKKLSENIVVQIYWSNDNPVDIDLWIKGPEDKPIGYSRKDGILCSLLRDDLGDRNDISGMNEEVAYCRGELDGEYVINVHSYSSSGGNFPIDVKMEVFLRGQNGLLNKIWSGQQEFSSAGQEKTFLRFILKNSSIQGDFNFVPKMLRSQQ